jgi:predicted PurR-regulated permease PerM
MIQNKETSTAKTLRIALLLAGLCLLLWALSDVVLLIFAAILIAVALRGVSEQVAKSTRLPPNAALALVSLFLLAAVAAFSWTLGPRFDREGQQLIAEIHAYAGHLQQHYEGTFWGQTIERSISTGKGLDIAPIAPKLLTVTFGTAGALLLMLATAFYLAVAPKLYIGGAVRLMPPAYRGRAFEILAAAGQTLRYWMLGQLIDMAVVGVLATSGLLLLHVNLPIALGVIAGVLTFVPYLGAILAGLPAVIVASTLGFSKVLWVVALYFGCHMIEGYLVAPIIARRMVRLPPALTVLAMSIMGTLYGFFGVLVATPLTAAMIVLIREIYIGDILGDRLPRDRDPGEQR